MPAGAGSKAGRRVDARVHSGNPNDAAVTLLAEATDSGVNVASAVANGVGNAMDLGLDPATRLNAIVVEACGNVAAHAYREGSPGNLELAIFAEPRAAGARTPARIHSRIRDFGDGMEFLPTAADPPGLGLSMISNLADEMTIRSEPSGGTSVEASVLVLDQAPSPQPGRAPLLPHGACELRFGALELAEAVLPRALVAHARGSEVTLDQVTETMLVGDAVAQAIEWAGRATVPTVRITRRGDDQGLRLRVGPLASEEVDELLSEIGSSWWSRDPALSVAIEAWDEDHDFALLNVPGPYG